MFSQVIASAELAGSFVDPAVFCKLALPHLKTSATSSSQSCTSCLMVLAALIRGSNPELLVPQLQVLSNNHPIAPKSPLSPLSPPTNSEEIDVVPLQKC